MAFSDIVGKCHWCGMYLHKNHMAADCPHPSCLIKTPEQRAQTQQQAERRRAELEERRQVIEHLFERADAAVEDNPNIEEYAEDRRFFQDWLAEIDAELEGSQ